MHWCDDAAIISSTFISRQSWMIWSTWNHLSNDV